MSRTLVSRLLAVSTLGVALALPLVTTPSAQAQVVVDVCPSIATNGPLLVDAAEQAVTPGHGLYSSLEFPFAFNAGDTWTLTLTEASPGAVAEFYVGDELIASGPSGTTYTFPTTRLSSVFRFRLLSGKLSVDCEQRPLAMASFSQPVDMGGTNQAKAGSTIPFKFSVADVDGNPVTTLTADDVQALRGTLGPCDGAGGDPIEETVASSLGGKLINNGDGTYQFNQKTEKAWAGKCGTLGLQVLGGNTQTARFTFK